MRGTTAEVYAWRIWIRSFVAAVLLAVATAQSNTDDDTDMLADISQPLQEGPKPPSSSSDESPAGRLRGSRGSAASGTEEEKEIASCHCMEDLEDSEDPACTCDLYDVDLDKDMPRLGLDRCAAFGTCEACSAAELDLGFCARTRHRQRVVCSRCRPLSSETSRICKFGVRPFWVAAVQIAANASNGEVSAREHLFYRSCGSVRPAGPLLHRTHWTAEDGGGEEYDDAIDREGGNEAPPRRGPLVDRTETLNDTVTSPPSAVGKSKLKASAGVPSMVRDESAELLCFAVLNAVALTLSMLSLRRQQLAITEKTMQGLGERIDASGTEDLHSSDAHARERSKTRAISVTSNLEAAAAMPESLGRSFEAVATAVARTGNAIERAVTEELTKASLATSGMRLELARTAEAYLPEGVAGTEHKMK